MKMKGCDCEAFVYIFTHIFSLLHNISCLSNFLPSPITTHYPLQQDRGEKAKSERKQSKEEGFLIQPTASVRFRCRTWSNYLGLLGFLYGEDATHMCQQKERSKPKRNNKSFRSRDRVRGNHTYYHLNNTKMYRASSGRTH